MDIGTKNQSTRETWIANELLHIPKGEKILDAGAGELRFKKFCGHLDYVSQDIAEYTGEGNREGLQTGTWEGKNVDIVSDITSIPVPDASFDVILCVEVFEHIIEPVKAVKEFSRILKKGGTLILTAPFSSLTHFAPYYFANGFSRYWYEKVLGEYGFQIVELVYNGNYFQYLAQEIRRIGGVAEKYSGASSFFLKPLSYLLLRILERFERTDKGSWELLCHGIQVRAVKK